MLYFAVLYKHTLSAWFQQDDFAWLALRMRVHNMGDLLWALFSPLAQGTIRPLSERAFFLTFSSWFGLQALPYRLLVYVTALCDIGLLSVLAYRLTKSYTASVASPIFWITNCALASPLTWTAAYNEILCSLVFLSGFLALTFYAESGERRYYIALWMAALLAFGVLEIAVVFPAIALLYALLCARRYVPQVAWLLSLSLAFVGLRAAIQTHPRGDYYAIFLGAMPGALLTYSRRVLAASAPDVVAMLLAAAILAFVVVQFRCQDRLPLFLLGWFGLSLAPFLPLKNHITDYYLTVPALGLALLGAYALSRAAASDWRLATAALVLSGAYLACQIPETRKNSNEIWERSRVVKRFVTSVLSLHDAHAGKSIVIEGVDEPLFWNGVFDHPFAAVGVHDIYLTPDTVAKIRPYPELGNVADYTISPYELKNGLAADKILVYRVQGAVLQDVTKHYTQADLYGELPQRIDLGHPLMESLLGPSWYPSEGDYRWMPKEATVRIGVPHGVHGEVRIDAVCNPIQVSPKPLRVSIAIDGKTSEPIEIGDCEHIPPLRFPLKAPTGAREIQVTVMVDHTVRVGQDQRDLGLAVRSIEVAEASR